MTHHRLIALLTGLMAATALLMTLTTADEPSVAKPDSATAGSGIREATIAALRPIGGLVGDWKGVGQPKRGSNAGAWSEKARAAWKFEDQIADLVVTFEPGQQFQKATFSLTDDGKTPGLTLEPHEGDPIKLTRTKSPGDAKSADESWIFESATDNWPQTRCTVRIISDIRVTLLFEEKPTEKASYRRLSEIGLTRAGAKLASGNNGERQCIVTGGLGTIKVSFEGKTYYVCCEGCKQAFDADPAGTIEAYRERLKEEAKGK